MSRTAGAAAAPTKPGPGFDAAADAAAEEHGGDDEEHRVNV